MDNPKKPYDIEDRLVKFAGDIILYCKSLPYDEAGRYLRDQMTRSGCAAALNYGESQGAESINDSIHKLGLVIKELKETRVSLKIAAYLTLGNREKQKALLVEDEELIAIIATIRKNKKSDKQLARSESQI